MENIFDRFTERAKKVLGLARREAQELNHDYIGTEHLLLGLVREGGGVAANVLRNLGVDNDRIREEVMKYMQPGPNMKVLSKLPFTPRVKKVLELSLEAAIELGHNYVGTEHLLLGLIRENDGVAAHVLLDLGLRLEEVRDAVLELLGSPQSQASEASPSTPASLLGSSSGPKRGKSKTPALDSFGRDLTELARENKLDP